MRLKQKKIIAIIAVLTVFFSNSSLMSADIIKHALICGDYGGQRIVEVDAKGDVTWEYPNINDCKDLWVLPNGNILFCAKGGEGKKGYRVVVVNRNKETVFEYKSNTEIHTCHYTPTGNILFVEAGLDGNQPHIIEMTIEGKEVRTLSLKTIITKGTHWQCRFMRLLENGNFIVCHTGEGKVKEYDSNGKVLSELKAKSAMSAIRLKNGNTVVSSSNGIITEYDKEKKIVRSITKENAPKECKKFRPAGIQILPNGNIVCCNAVPGGNISMIEFDKDNNVIDITKTKVIGPVVRLQILDSTDNSMR